MWYSQQFCVCDPLPASARLHLLDKPSPLTSDKQVWSGDSVRHPEHCIVRASAVVVIPVTGTSNQGKEDNHGLCILYRTEYGVMSGRRLRQISSQPELPGHLCYSDQFVRSLRLQSDINWQREIIASDLPCS